MSKITIQRIPKRIVLLLMVFIAYANLSFTNMTTQLATQLIILSSSINSNLEIDYNAEPNLLTIESIKYGRLMSPLGGILAIILGGGTLHAISIMLLALIIPISSFLLDLSHYSYIVANTFVGVLEGFSYASFLQLWYRWVPSSERTKFIAFSSTGSYVGLSIAFYAFGYIVNFFPVKFLYYMIGAINFIWFWTWFNTVSDDPEKHKTKAEKELIIKKTKSIPTGKSFPWIKIITCPPVLVGCLVKYSIACSNGFIKDHLSQFAQDKIDPENDENIYFSIIPIFFSLLLVPVIGCLIDYIRIKRIISLTNLHRCFGTIVLHAEATTILIVSFWLTTICTIICAILHEFFSTLIIIEIRLLVLDIAPRFAAFINSLTLFSHTVGSILTPKLIDALITDHSYLQSNICFMALSGFNFLVAMCYLKYSSGKLQTWAERKDNKVIKNVNNI